MTIFRRADGANEKFRAFCRMAAYDVIFFKFLLGGGASAPFPLLRAQITFYLHINKIYNSVFESMYGVRKHIDNRTYGLPQCCG